MTPRRAVQLSIAKTVFVPGIGAQVIEIDRVKLLTSLLTFDEVVLISSHFGEVPFLIKLFGFEGFTKLFEANVIRITSETCAIAVGIAGNGVVGLGANQFPQLFISQKGTAEQCEHALLKVSGLKRAKLESLVQAVVSDDILLPPSFGSDLHKQNAKDLTVNRHLLNHLLAREFPGAPTAQIHISVTQLPEWRGHNALELGSNFTQVLGITKDRESLALANLYKAVGNLNIQLGRMESCSAISAFNEADAPILFGKLHGLIAPRDPTILQDAFLRVLGLTDIPQAIESSRIDVDRLLAIRETAECREFRRWLAGVDEITDADLSRVVTGFKAKAAYFLSSVPGKAIRFAVNTGLGFAGVGALLPIIEGFVDTFLLDRLLPSSGILTFLRGSVPSIFD